MPKSLLLATLGLLLLAARPALAGEAVARAQAAPASTPAPEAEAAPARPAEHAPDAGTLSRIRIQGNRRVESDAIRAGLPLREGETYDKTILRNALLAVWRLGYFDDVRLDVSRARPPEPPGLILTVVVSEKPAIHDVRLEGNDELSKDDFKDIIEVRQYQILDPELARKSARKMQEKYVEKGFFLAEVSTRMVPLPNNEVDVVFVIDEHAKVSVKEIHFVGNKVFTDDELKSVMATQEGNFLSFVTSAGNYREDVLFQRDQYLIQHLYLDKGYINLKMGKPAVSISADKKYIFITFTFEEGDPYTLGSIDVSGDLLESKEKLLSMVRLKPGDTFNQSILVADMQVLTDVYKDKGYAYANVTPDTPNSDPVKHTVDLSFNFSKGNLVTIEKIEVVGNTKTRDRVIRREMRINEGDLFSGTGVRVSKQRINALGFFDGVELNTRRGSTDDKMVIEVSLREKLTGTFQVGFGFTGGESFFGQATLSQNNLFGYGHTASLSLQLSSIRQLFQVSYLDPYLFDTPFTGGIDLYRSELLYGQFDRRAIGGSLTTGYEIFEDFRAFAAYTLEQVDVVPQGVSAQILRNQFLSGRTSSLRFSLNYDKRDNRLFPTAGHLESVSAEFAPSILGSQNLFQRYRVGERRYYPLFWGLIFKMNLNLGYIRSTDPIDRPVAISEKFFAGGINSLRGYSLRTISPTKKVASSRDPDAGLIDYPIGGNKELTTNWEVEFPIVESAGVRGVLFYDAGNTFAEDEKLFSSRQRGGNLPLGLFHSVGAGVRWFSPLGPLRFETGFPLTRRAVDDPYLFEFTIGNFF